MKMKTVADKGSGLIKYLKQLKIFFANYYGNEREKRQNTGIMCRFKAYIN